MSLSNEYEKLLDIIDDEKKKKKKNIKKEQPVKDDKPKKSKSSSIDDYKQININKDYVTKSSINYNYNSKNTEFNIDTFKSILRKDLIANYYKIRNYERPYISITEILGCIRKCYYERMKYKVDESQLFNFPQLKIIQEVGNKLHDLIQNNYDLGEVEKVLKSENYKLKGRVDAVKNSTVFEIKSIDPDEYPIKKIRENDYKQGIIYGYILKYEYGYDIKYLEVIYVSRNLKDMQVLKVEIDFKRAEELMEKSKELHKCLTLTKPPSIYNKPEEECKFCHFKKYCKEETNEPINEEDNKNKHINIFELGD